MERASAAATAPSRSPWALRLREAIARRKRLLIALCGALLALVVGRAFLAGASAGTMEDALAASLARSDLRVEVPTVMWLGQDRGPLRMRGALFLARRPNELADLYYAEIRPGGSGTVLDVAWLTNVSRTASAEEEQLVRSGDQLAYLTRVGRRYDAIVVVDARGEPESLTADWPARARAQNAITNLQETGRREGFGVRRYQLIERAPRAHLHTRDGRFAVSLGDAEVEIDPLRAQPLAGAELVETQLQPKGMPGAIAWVVDTVRGISWVGPEPIEWLEHRVFGVQDSLNRAYHAVVGSGDTAAEAAADLAPAVEATPERIAMLTATDPELGWPPPPIEPIVRDTEVEGEGRWLPIVDDPYVNQYTGAPPAFYQTFLRADPERGYARVYVTMWDPRQVQLRIQAGTREPESATGQRGAGEIPRDDRLRWLVGAFNGGFQALHGEFGMMADGRVYLPPKPWAATVAVFNDGRTGMGSWPAPDWRGQYYDERLANRQIPDDMIDMRQNLTSVVENEQFNPWQRWWWGAAPVEAAEQTFTTRSGLCLTTEGFYAYFWGNGMGPEQLGAAMSAARCARGIHLDMNIAHCGFELFRPIAPGEEAPPLAHRPRADSEFEGAFPDAPGWRLRARRGVRSMGMPFPRYSGRDGRDFFYLELRPVLPGPPLANMPAGQGAFATQGLPHAGWPHAFARAFVGPEGARTWIVRIDPRRAVPSPLHRPEQQRALAYVTQPPREGARSLVARRTDVGFAFAIVEAPREGDSVLLAGDPLNDASASAAIGIDRDGFLVYAERAGDGAPLASRLHMAGVDDAIALGAARLAFAAGSAQVGPDGYEQRPVDPTSSMALYAEERPAAEVLWPDNQPMPYSRWGYLQGQRVRYFPEGPPRFARPTDVPPTEHTP